MASAASNGPSSSIAMPLATNGAGTLAQHSISRGKRFKPAASKNIVQTSLYQYPSNSSLASLGSQQSSKNTLVVDTPKILTTVIPPFAGAPPTGPLPPTPPLEVTSSETKLPDELASLGVSNDTGLQKDFEKVSKVKVVVGVIAGHSGDETAKRCLRRVKGDVAEAAISYRRFILKDAAGCHTQGSIGNLGTSADDHGLPTPESTPPAATSQSQQHLFTNALTQDNALSSKQNNLPCDDSSDGEDDGGIAIEYDSLGLEHGEWSNKDYKDKPECPSTPGVPRPDSPFVIGFEFQSDDGEVLNSPKGELAMAQHGATSSCEDLPSEFTILTQIKSGKAEIPQSDSEDISLLSNNQVAAIDAIRSTVSVRGSTTSTILSLPGRVQLETLPENSDLQDFFATTGERDLKGELVDAEMCIRQSSILKRRLAARDATPQKNRPKNKVEEVKEAEKQTDTDGDSKGDSLQSAELPKAIVLAEPSKTPAIQKNVVPSSLFMPPSLPQFNFIPPTPLSLATPSTFVEKQLGEVVPPRRSSSARSFTRGRPGLATQQSRFRDNKLHPWWRPRSYWQEEQHDFAKLLSDTETVVIRPNSDAAAMLSGIAAAEETEVKAVKRDKRRRWSGGGLSTTAGVDKKRTVVTLGKVQIEFIGFDGLMGVFKAWNRTELDKSKEAPTSSMPRSPTSALMSKLHKRKAGKENVSTDT